MQKNRIWFASSFTRLSTVSFAQDRPSFTDAPDDKRYPSQSAVEKIGNELIGTASDMLSCFIDHEDVDSKDLEMRGMAADLGIARGKPGPTLLAPARAPSCVPATHQRHDGPVSAAIPRKFNTRFAAARQTSPFPSKPVSQL